MTEERPSPTVKVSQPTVTNQIYTPVIVIVWPDGTYTARILSKSDLRGAWMYAGHYLPLSIANYLFPQLQASGLRYRTLEEAEAL